MLGIDHHSQRWLIDHPCNCCHGKPSRNDLSPSPAP
jgi:hypothetical protein